MTLRIKMLAAFLIISTVPVIIITLYTYGRYTRLIDEQIAGVAEGIFVEAEGQLNDGLDKINQIYQMLTLYTADGTSVMDDVEKYANADAAPENYDIFLSNQKLKFVCQSAVFSNDYVNGVFIFTPSGITLGYGYGGYIDVHYSYSPEGDEWYERTVDRMGATYVDGVTVKDYFIGSKPSITFSRALYGLMDREFLGVLQVDCSPDIFDLSNINTLPKTVLLSVQNTDNGFTLYTNVDSIPSVPMSTEMQLSKKTLSLENLTLTQAVDFDQLYRDFSHIQIIIVVIAGVCCLVILVISISVSLALTRPITHLSRRMANRSGHNIATEEKYLRRSDEVGILYNEYNNMLEELDRGVKTNYQNRLITLDSQMKALEAQINSHFLYNTLESINSIAVIENVDSIAVMSLALGNMFRYSIKTKSELVTLADEISHVNDYVSIQAIRYDNRFKFTLNIPQKMYPMRLLKLVLQPIVENALLHGLLRCQAGGEITISGQLQGGDLLLCVQDDGVGMQIEQLNEIRGSLAQPPKFTELGQRDSQSIGLKNIHSRIELYYGKGYGLSVESAPNQGTRIEIRVPTQV